ncbi:MAG: NPCBM/NEW2 domain-containing protein [Armatimonadota bacterium]
MIHVPSFCKRMILLAAFMLLLTTVAVPAAENGLRWETAMRTLWTTGATEASYLREWLLCGPIPYQAGQPGNAGAAVDFLQAGGGEEHAHPADGQVVKRPDGSEVAWMKYKSGGDLVNLTVAFGGKPVSAVAAYAFTTIHREAAGKAYISTSSDDGLRIWLNGKLVHDRLITRGLFMDDDLIEVDLQAGDNTVLLKVTQDVEFWAFCFRLLDVDAGRYLALTRANPVKLWPVILNEGGADAGKLVIATDSGAIKPPVSQPDIAVTVTAPGGKQMAAQTVPYGARAVFDAVTWADGPYDVTCRMIKANGIPLTAHRVWYKGDMLAAVRRLASTAPASGGGSTPAEMIHGMLADILKYRLKDNFENPGPELLAYANAPLMEFAELQQAEAGGTGGLHPYGFVRLAYRDELDGMPQFARAYLPAHYDPAKKWPLLINLHGYMPANPPYARWWGVENRFDMFADAYDVISIYPHGRGNTSYLGYGERDVLRCIELAKQRFSVDDQRVYLVGYSMGGSGTWNVGTRHPELFAAIAPVYGGWDYRIAWDEQEQAGLTPEDRFRLERGGTFAQLESLLTTPVLVNHGDKDASVTVEFSRFTVGMLQRWGYDVRYWEHPGLGHGPLGSEELMMQWLLSHRLVTDPPHVRLRAGELKSAAAHWVRVEQRENPLAFLQVDAEVVGPNTLRLTTDNVLAITLSPGKALVDPSKPLQVLWNGKEVRTVMLNGGRVTLAARGYTPQAGEKRPTLEGPMGDAFNTPFAIVEGTIAPDPLMRAMCRLRARELADNWARRQNWQPRYFKDTEISDAEKGCYTLLLVGGPEENLVSKAIAEKLPLRLTAHSVILDGKEIAATDAAAQMIYPSPFNVDRYIVLWAATSPAGQYFSNHSNSASDFYIGDGRDLPVAQGYFDSTWHLRDTAVEYGNPKKRAKSLVRTAPTYPTAEVAGKRLWLADLLETRADGVFTDIMRRANMQGQPMTLGWRAYDRGLSVPTWGSGTVEYDLAGGNWTRLQAVLGYQLDRTQTISARQKEKTRIVLVVKGDDKELFRSAPILFNSPAQQLNVDITGLKILRLEVVNPNGWNAAPGSVEWANLRLER